MIYLCVHARTHALKIGNIGIVNIYRYLRSMPITELYFYPCYTCYNKRGQGMLERDRGPGFTALRRDNGDAIVESTPKFFLGHIKVLHL
jgi:hypothetical protein